MINIDNIFCDIGWVWDGVQFLNPNPPVVEEITDTDSDPTDTDSV